MRYELKPTLIKAFPEYSAAEMTFLECAAEDTRDYQTRQFKPCGQIPNVKAKLTQKPTCFFQCL